MNNIEFRVGSYFRAKSDSEKYMIVGTVIDNNSTGDCYLMNLRSGFFIGPCVRVKKYTPYHFR